MMNRKIGVIFILLAIAACFGLVVSDAQSTQQEYQSRATEQTKQKKNKTSEQASDTSLSDDDISDDTSDDETIPEYGTDLTTTEDLQYNIDKVQFGLGTQTVSDASFMIDDDHPVYVSLPSAFNEGQKSNQLYIVTEIRNKKNKVVGYRLKVQTPEQSSTVENITPGSPILELKQDKITVHKNDDIPYDSVVQKAADHEDGDITNLVYHTYINTNVLGDQQVVYSVSDSDGNTVSKELTVSVVK